MINYYDKYLEYKNKYLSLKNTQNGSGKSEKATVKINDKIFTGAGIILVEEFTNKKGRKEIAVILFRNIRMNMYADLGGRIDHHDTLQKYPLVETAIREAFEESRCMIDIIDPTHIIKKFGHIDSFIDTKQYRCHFVGIKSGLLYNQDYKKNMKLIDSSRISHSYKETDDVARFYISDLIKSGILTSKNDFNTLDSYGNKVRITSRARVLISDAIRSGLIYVIAYNPFDFKKSKITIKNIQLMTIQTVK